MVARKWCETGCSRRGWAAAVVALMLLSTGTAEASHFRGADMWASIDANGVVRVTARTRWRKDFAEALGISPARFGISSFGASAPGCPGLNVSPASGMRI